MKIVEKISMNVIMNHLLLENGAGIVFLLINSCGLDLSTLCHSSRGVDIHVHIGCASWQRAEGSRLRPSGKSLCQQVAAVSAQVRTSRKALEGVPHLVWPVVASSVEPLVVLPQDLLGESVRDIDRAIETANLVPAAVEGALRRGILVHLRARKWREVKETHIVEPARFQQRERLLEALDRLAGITEDQHRHRLNPCIASLRNYLRNVVNADPLLHGLQ
jgi:hypothetical protein